VQQEEVKGRGVLAQQTAGARGEGWEEEGEDGEDGGEEGERGGGKGVGWEVGKRRVGGEEEGVRGG